MTGAGPASPSPPRAGARLLDEPHATERTTHTLIASLATRLATLRLVSGADAFGSLAAGYAALGRQVADTADGARMREALERSHAGQNSRELWAALGIDDLATAPPSPVLDQLRNDLALLLADDLEDALLRSHRPGSGGGETDQEDAEPVDAVDYLVGMWAFAREVLTGVEAIADQTLRPAGAVRPAPATADQPEGPLLR